MVNAVSPLSHKPFVLHCEINNISVPFELDSGSHVSTLNKCFAKQINAKIQPSSVRLRGYSGASVNVLGQANVKLRFHNRELIHDFFVVDSCSIPNLLGRDLCTKLDINVLIPDGNTAHNISNDVLSQFRDYLSETFQSCVKDEVHLGIDENCKPKFCKARPVPVKLKDAVNVELERLIEQGIVSKVYSSDWASPAVYVRKSNGSIRVCVDYSTTINKHLTTVNAPLPTVDEVIASVGEAKVFSKLDLQNAYLQLPLDEESKNLTTVNTHAGLLRYNFLPFGTKSSPSIFQAYLTKLLHNIPNVIIYMDDLLILTNDRASHDDVLYQVLTRLKEAGVKLNATKCEFFVDHVHYLGHIFSKNGVHTDPEKVRAITAAPPPTNVKQLQSFLGLCTFYGRFLPNFACVLHPLYCLLKKGTKFVWGNEQQQCFDTVKDLFCNHKVLKLYNPKNATMLECDASNYGVAAVLFQRENSSQPWHPVQYASRSLNNAETNYSNIEREALSVIFGVEKFKKFLLGSHFIIHNDHAPLRKLFASDASVPSTCSARIQRWSLRLSQFDYTLKYIKGVDNVHSDCLSRLPLNETVTECEPYELVFVLESLDETNVTCDDIKLHTDADKDLTELKHYIKYGAPNNIKNSNLSKYKSILSELTIVKGCILYNNRVLVPPALRKIVLTMFHSEHPGITAMKSLARSLIWYPGLNSDIEEIVKTCNICQVNRAKPPQNNNVVWPTPARPWSRIHVDHFFLENKTCLVVVDALSKYIECEIVCSTSVDETIDALRLIFSRNGLCDILVSDNATSFTGEKFQQFLTNNGIQHVTSPPYCPSSNGQAERAVRTIKDLLKKNRCNQSFKTRLSRILFQYRSTPHSVTQIAPAVALNNRKFVTIKDRLHPNFSLLDSSNCKPQQITQYEVGQNVLVLNLREKPKWCQGKITKRLGINVYIVHVAEFDVLWKRHSNQMLPASCNLNMREYDVPCPSEDNACENRRTCRVKKPVVRFGF